MRAGFNSVDDFQLVSEENRDRPWIIMITDDIETVHMSTKFALEDKIIHGRPIVFIDAYSGVEAQVIVQEREDIDLMLLDAVMETDNAGLELAKFIKLDLARKFPTIIMRTGFAGWEIEMNNNNLECIDDFILKSNASQKALLDILEKWLPLD